MGITDERLKNENYNYDSRQAKEVSKKLVNFFENFFKSKTTKELVTELRSRDIPCEPIRFIKEMLEDEQSIANDYIVSLKHSMGFKYKSAGPILQFTQDSSMNFDPSPALGQHTDEILGELGISKNSIAKLKNQGIIK